jgi:hypothetical protein
MKLEPGWYRRLTIGGTTSYSGPYRTRLGAWIGKSPREQVRRIYPT